MDTLLQVLRQHRHAYMELQKQDCHKMNYSSLWSPVRLLLRGLSLKHGTDIYPGGNTNCGRGTLETVAR